MHRWALIGFVIVGAALAAPAGEKKGEPPLVIRTAGGKDAKLKSWRFTAGIRRLPGAEGKGPLCLEFRDVHSTTYQNGILTFIPLSSLRQLDYDQPAKSVTAVVATPGKDLTRTGTTKYAGINRITIEGDADLGELGFASVKFQGGPPKGVITGVRFPNPAPLPALDSPPGTHTATITGADKERTRHTVTEPSVLYQVAGGSTRLVPQLFFKKTVRLDLAKLASLRRVEPEDKKQAALDFEVALAAGEKLALTLLTKAELDGKPATLVGVFGRVAAGYALFPPHTIMEMQMSRSPGGGGKE